MNELEIEREAEGQPPPSKWKGIPSIQLARQLNEQCIELLCEFAVEASPEVSWLFVTSNRDLWSRLDAISRQRLAIWPFVIVDVRFKDEAWWRTLGAEKLGAMRESSTLGAMPSSRCECLALETLMFAWQVAREDRRVARMIFAMTPQVADCIAALTMQQIRTIAVRGARCLSIRWSEDPHFWRELLISAREADEITLAALRRHAKLLFCGELLGGDR